MGDFTSGTWTVPPLAAAWAQRLGDFCTEMGVERATFVGNSLGCPVICELAHQSPDLVERAVLVSPAGGPNIRFGVVTSLQLIRAMTAFPTIDRARGLSVPVLAIAGERDPLVRPDRISVLHGMPHLRAATVPGAHALNYSHPETIAALIEAHERGDSFEAASGPLAGVREVRVPG